MPKNPSTTAPKKTKSTNKTPAKSPRAADPDAPAGLTPNQAAVLQRLCEQAGMSTAEVAAAESIGHSTAQKALTVLEAAGLARREAGVRNGALKSPDQWFTATTTPATSTDLESTQDAPPAPTDTDDATAADVAGKDDGDPDVQPADFTAAMPSTVSADPEPDGREALEPVDADTTSQGESQESAAGSAQPDMTEPEGPASEPDGDSATEPGSSDVQSTQPAPAEEAAQEQAATAEDAQPEEAAVVQVAGSDDDAPTEQEQLAPPAAAPGLSPGPSQSVEPDAVAKGKPKPRPKKEPTTAAPAAVTPKPEGAAAPATARLAHGELQQMVADHLRAHPERAWTPSATAKALGGKSAGAVANACEKLLGTMDGLKTFDDAPRRYQYTPPAPPKTKKTK